MAEDWRVTVTFDETGLKGALLNALHEEHERLEAEETAESQAAGIALWEVRVALGSHHDAVELAKRLELEGQSVVRRWKFLLVEANNEDEARAIAQRLKIEAPQGATIQVEPGTEAVWEIFGNRPFAVFGGFAS